MTYLSHSPMQTTEFAIQFAESLKGGEFLAFYGDLGAGKTRFISGIAKAFGCIDHASSPTFAIVNYYRGPKPLCHFDMYRIDADSLEDTGFYDYMDQGVTIACEWCENIAQEIPTDAIRITIEKGEESDTRIIRIEGGAYEDSGH
jgi:tRNA threonylcarbamoyladenosine biosynthesis protein TsaE